MEGPGILDEYRTFWVVPEGDDVEEFEYWMLGKAGTGEKSVVGEAAKG
jgi:hypothetical protein